MSDQGDAGMVTHHLRFMLTDEHGIENMLAWMRGHRLRSRLTQAQVAERMGCSQSQVSEIESGKLDIRIATLQRYARAIGLTPGINVVPPGEHW